MKLGNQTDTREIFKAPAVTARSTVWGARHNII
jgi:hypothetical protein